MSRKLKSSLTLSIVIVAFVVAGLINERSRSASLTSVSVTLSNARPSFRGGLAAGNVVSTSQAIINTTAGAYPSTSSGQLVEGDSLLIGEAGSLGTYVVASTSSQSTINLKSVLAAGDADAADDVIASTSSTLSVRFVTASAVNAGKFRVLVPALASNTAAADGIPDGGYFDYGTSAPTVTCPTNQGNYTFSSSTSAASSVTIGSVEYHSFVCPYTGTGSVGASFTANPLTIASLINPAPKSTHSLGTADTYQVVIQNLDGSDNVIDSTAVSIGVIEAVRVTATVPPQISFRILGVNAGTTICNRTTNVATTPAAVPFGEILIDNFTLAAQQLVVSTNAAGGYAVTSDQSDQMGKDGIACAGLDGSGLTNCIPDAGVASMTSTTGQEWANDTTKKGFAYSMDAESVAGIATFEYDDGAASFLARHFADYNGGTTSEAPVQIMSYADPADNHYVDVCYRIIASSTTEAGAYENFIRYTATATF